jgi:hypothetical protein
LATAALSGFVACTPNSGVTVQESDVVATVFDREVDFGAIGTFAMPDTVLHIEGSDSTLLTREYDDEILSLVAANFEARGYVRVDTTSQVPPDVAVTVRAAATKVYSMYSYYPWWGWGYPGWGWGGCCYYYPPSVGVSYAFSAGTVFVDMSNPNQAETDGDTPIYWVGAVNGVLDDSAASIKNRLADSINQLFIQSPYLQSNVNS